MDSLNTFHLPNALAPKQYFEKSGQSRLLDLFQFADQTNRQLQLEQPSKGRRDIQHLFQHLPG